MTPGEGSLMSSASDDRFEARRVLPYLWHPVVVFACVMAAYLAVDVIAQQRNVVGEIHGDLTAVNMAVLFFASAISVFELANVVVSLFRLNAVRLLFHLLALLIGAAVFGRQIAVAVQYANLYLFPQIYADCQQSAAAYGDQARFRLCSARSDGGAYTIQ
jgi:heme/copper-type cytochrome/quinol oxidase subunit 3